jgi:hypothetical protein
MIVEDLDILRPEPRIIRIGGKEIDVSFIPCGITFEVDSIVQELSKIDATKLSGTDPEVKKGFVLSIQLCLAFCTYRYPELNQEWFEQNVSASQIKVFAGAIEDALKLAYAGVSDTTKKPKATKKQIQ